MVVGAVARYVKSVITRPGDSGEKFSLVAIPFALYFCVQQERQIASVTQQTKLVDDWIARARLPGKD